MHYAGIEAPVNVKKRLEKEGINQPAVYEACASTSRVEKDTGLRMDGEKIRDLFYEEDKSLVPLAGEVIMEVPLAWRARRGQNVDQDEVA